MTLQHIVAMLEACTTASRVFPPSLLYNEGWLLRLVLDWFSTHPAPGHPLGFPPGARWFSEALLPTAFGPRFRGDRLAESWTHADGVIGHFAVGGKGTTNLALSPGAGHLVVLEAKIMSGLSAGVSNAPYFDQAARSVACMAQVLRRAGRCPAELSCLGFYVLAPRSQIERGVFRKLMSRKSIHGKVRKRAAAYGGARDAWQGEWFEPTLERMAIEAIPWEEAIDAVGEQDPASAAALLGFYRRCLEALARRSASAQVNTPE